MDPELLRARARASVGAEGRASPLTRSPARRAGREPLAQGGQKGGASARPLPCGRSVGSCAALPSRRRLWAPRHVERRALFIADFCSIDFLLPLRGGV